MRHLLGGMLEAAHPIAIVDMEAGLEHLSRGTARHVDTLVIVLEPYYKALEIGRRAAELGRELGISHVAAIANKLRDGEDADAVTAFAGAYGLPIMAQVPLDDAIRRGDLAGRAPIESPDSPAVKAIAALANQVVRAG